MLITGCPRSATQSVAEYFQNHGVALGHQMAGEMGTVEWRHAYSEKPDFVIILALVRDPLDTVRSLTELLMNCDRKSDTWKAIAEQSVLGNWDRKLKDCSWVGAATNWWTTVYERLYQYPLLKVEHLPKLPDTNRHPRVGLNFNLRKRLKDCKDFWRVARMYGYYLEDSSE